jgi:hypothetical protein
VTQTLATILVPCGQLGAGVRAAEVERGLALGADAIAVDAGSTDSGAAYLARGVSKNSAEAVRDDLRVLMAAAARARIPLIVGSCGTAGGDAGVDWTAAIARELAAELDLAPRIALLYSEQTAAELKRRNAQGRIRPLPPMGPLADETLEACDHIVAVLGAEPYIAALRAGADVILGGRTTDTALIAALPLMKGAPAGLAWHAAKVAECGGLCTDAPGRAAGVLIRIGADAFEIEPLDERSACTPHTVSAHMLYENSDPFRLVEPGGVLDVSAARYEAASARVTRVAGAVWRPMPYTLKLEGAQAGPYQTLMLVGIEDPQVLANLDEFEGALHAALTERVRRTLGDAAGDYHISLRLYGWNAVSGVAPPPQSAPPREVGVLFVATAATQQMATRIAKTCNPWFFHFPFRGRAELPSYGFAFTPAEIERGRVFEFRLNHVVEVDDPLDLSRLAWIVPESAHAQTA